MRAPYYTLYLTAEALLRASVYFRSIFGLSRHRAGRRLLASFSINLRYQLLVGLWTLVVPKATLGYFGPWCRAAYE